MECYIIDTGDLVPLKSRLLLLLTVILIAPKIIKRPDELINIIYQILSTKQFLADRITTRLITGGTYEKEDVTAHFVFFVVCFTHGV